MKVKQNLIFKLLSSSSKTLLFFLECSLKELSFLIDSPKRLELRIFVSKMIRIIFTLNLLFRLGGNEKFQGVTFF